MLQIKDNRSYVMLPAVLKGEVKTFKASNRLLGKSIRGNSGAEDLLILTKIDKSFSQHRQN
jgi:hypothetical protein